MQPNVLPRNATQQDIDELLKVSPFYRLHNPFLVDKAQSGWMFPLLASPTDSLTRCRIPRLA